MREQAIMRDSYLKNTMVAKLAALSFAAGLVGLSTLVQAQAFPATLDLGDLDGNNGIVINGFKFGAFAGQGFPASLEQNSVDGTNGFVLNGIDQGDFFGRSVSAAGM